MAQRQTSIQKRVRAVILLASVIVLFVTAGAFVIYEAINFRAQLVRNLSTLAAVIADNSVAPLAFDNKAIAEEILAALRAQSDIEAAAVYDDDGNIFATYPPALPASLLPSAVEGKGDRKSTRLNSSHSQISYAVFCLKKKKYSLTSSATSSFYSGPALRTTLALPPRNRSSRRSPACNCPRRDPSTWASGSLYLSCAST